jgi:UDP-glucose 4-epimerase
MKLAFDKILVTGGAGFIGSHMADALLSNGVEVWVLDNLYSGSLRNLKQSRNHPNFHFVKGDIRERKTVNSLARKVDAIVHMAAVISPTVSIRKPELTNDVNVTGTLNLLQAAVTYRVNRFVFASSCAIYGTCKKIPTPETSTPEPITPYGASKLAAEKYCSAYHKAYGLATVALRYFNVYGERQDSSNPYSGVIAIFAQKLRSGGNPTIYGDGNQTRDFTHVSDVVNANLLALTTSRGIGEAFNIGTGRATTIKGLYRTMANLASREARPVFRNARPGDIQHSCADLHKARKLLAYEPNVRLRTGLRRLMESLTGE